MSNILKVTTPVAGYDNTGGVKINQSNVPQNNNIQGQVIPDKVVRPDARSDAASQQADAELKFQYDTNFDKAGDSGSVRTEKRLCSGDRPVSVHDPDVAGGNGFFSENAGKFLRPVFGKPF